MKKLFLVLISIVPGFAQIPGNIIPASRLIFPAELKQYLGLSDAQAGSIVQINMDYNRLAVEKSMRSAQVQGEIAEWTAKEPLEPMQLGLRYTELEVIRRELRDAMARTREKTLAVLDTAQKARLKTLEDAMKLQPVITQAQCQNLLLQPQAASGILSPLPIRTGDFAFTNGGTLGGTSYASFLLGMPGVNCGPLFVANPLPPGAPNPQP